MSKDIKRDIVMWGCGLEGEKFYWAWRHKINILYAIDMRYQTLHDFHGIKVYNPQAIENLKEYYIVVCVADEDIWCEVSELLKAKGLVEFENYIRSDLYCDKKLAVLYGNCHMEAIEKYLKSNIEFSRSYCTRLYYVNNVGGECFPTEAALKNCDLFISQDINERNTKKLPSAFELRRKLKKESKSVIIPNVYGMNLYFPQCEKGKFGEALKKHFEAFKINIDEKRGKKLWQQLDWMNEISDTNINMGGRIQCIMDLNTYSIQEIANNAENEILKLERREKMCDITISDFIRNNFRNQKLFYEPYHPAGILLKEKAKRILQIIGIKNTDFYTNLGEMDSKELPVYASVSKALGLRFECQYIRKSRGNPISIEEYVQHYVRWEIEPCGENDDGTDK